MGSTSSDYTRMTYDLTLGWARLLAGINPAMAFVYVSGAGTEAWTDGRGVDVENYHLEKEDRTNQWNLVHAFGATNREMAGTTIATIPKLADAAVILRGVIERDLKSHYAGIVNGFDGRICSESGGAFVKYASLAAVERALDLRR